MRTKKYKYSHYSNISFIYLLSIGYNPYFKYKNIKKLFKNISINGTHFIEK